MAVFDRGYRGYDGPLTQPWSRFLVIARYAVRDVFASKVFIGFSVLSLIWPLALVGIIYLKYNVEALTILDLSTLDLIPIDTTFFRLGFLRPQTAFAFVMILIVGPALVSPDLRNNALPLYLSRPLDKSDYVLGKLVVLATLTSAVTWVPGLLLFALQSYLAGGRWLLDHWRIPLALFVGSWIFILVLSLFSLAVSAWVKWKPWARIAFLGAIFVFSAIGQIFKLIYGTWWGSLLVVDDLMVRVWDHLFGIESSQQIPALVAWIALAIFGAFSAWLLFRRIRAFEVVS
ncbi:MAG TPA: hypothetical protein VMT85_03735 [Thermoanaerobaculia bacterium]|nr:hypothetical protein [Thermoanaerobaculia bacterium]